MDLEDNVTIGMKQDMDIQLLRHYTRVPAELKLKGEKSLNYSYGSVHT